MRELIPKRLWIGNAADARDHNTIFSHQVVAVVDLAIDESPAATPREIAYIRIPLHDSSSNPRETIRMAVNTLVALVREEIPTLVCCSMGMSRSPTIAAVALAVAEQSSPDTILEKYFTNAPRDVSAGLWNTAVEASKELLP